MKRFVNVGLSGSEELMLQKLKDSFAYEMDDAQALRNALRVACQQMGIMEAILDELEERGEQ